MTILEAVEQIKKEKSYSEENLDNLKKAIAEEGLTDFKDPRWRPALELFNDWPYDERVQHVIYYIAGYFEEKGIPSPCMSGCNDECVFHEFEFGKGTENV